ncbi:SDR family oxidoreductase [Parvularcula sp. LCG005]|uniref:SDR family oxidoreductase n=1 Tax=Parvularcula sp. LCG005 TaxID=3078805 RepID=UPI002942CA40|nr:SDR family oxidoreductase [Parvularcula sp. LCG005]WOI53015.1 SDR family oxidoreductase [Parvularcula sp. LCG005]
MRILVAGATGQTGRLLTHQLADSGHTPVALVRESSDVSVLPAGCETRTGDLQDLPQGIADNVDAIVFAAGSGGDTGEEMTDRIDRDGAKALIDVAKNSGIERFVMLSSVGADRPSSGPDGLQHYLEAKQAADQHLEQSGLNYTIVRPVRLTNEGLTGQITLSTDHLNSGEISRADVASTLAASLGEPAASNRIFEIASGPTDISTAIKSLH